MCTSAFKSRFCTLLRNRMEFKLSRLPSLMPWCEQRTTGEPPKSQPPPQIMGWQYIIPQWKPIQYSDEIWVVGQWVPVRERSRNLASDSSVVYDWRFNTAQRTLPNLGITAAIKWERINIKQPGYTLLLWPTSSVGVLQDTLAQRSGYDLLLDHS